MRTEFLVQGITLVCAAAFPLAVAAGCSVDDDDDGGRGGQEGGLGGSGGTLGDAGGPTTEGGAGGSAGSVSGGAGSAGEAGTAGAGGVACEEPTSDSALEAVKVATAPTLDGIANDTSVQTSFTNLPAASRAPATRVLPRPRWT